jgi:hypothetical protein
MQQVAILSMAAKAHQAGATPQQMQTAIGGGQPGGQNSTSTANAQMATPDLGAIQNQITNQVQ